MSTTLNAPTIGREFRIGDDVVIPEAFGPGSGSWPGRIASFIEDEECTCTLPMSATTHGQLQHRFCSTCHCDPVEPEHRGDGSMCCPGPWYHVTAPCADRCTTGQHEGTYAEHELRRAPECSHGPDDTCATCWDQPALLP